MVSPDWPAACCWIVMVVGDAKLRWIIPNYSNKMEILSELRVQHITGINLTVKEKSVKNKKDLCRNKKKKCGWALLWWVKGTALSSRPYICVVDQLKAKNVVHSNKPLNTLSAFTLSSTWLGSRKRGNNTSMAMFATAVIKDVLQPITKPLSHLFLIIFIYYFLPVTRYHFKICWCWKG